MERQLTRAILAWAYARAAEAEACARRAQLFALAMGQWGTGWGWAEHAMAPQILDAIFNHMDEWDEISS